jgi:hypothetical protein
MDLPVAAGIAVEKETYHALLDKLALGDDDQNVVLPRYPVMKPVCGGNISCNAASKVVIIVVIRNRPQQNESLRAMWG